MTKLGILFLKDLVSLSLDVDTHISTQAPTFSSHSQILLHTPVKEHLCSRGEFRDTLSSVGVFLWWTVHGDDFHQPLGKL